jgi:hypothetical protein
MEEALFVEEEGMKKMLKNDVFLVKMEEEEPVASLNTMYPAGKTSFGFLK